MVQEIQRELQQEKSEHELDQAKLNELKQADLELRRVHQEILARKDQELQQKALEYTHLTEKVHVSAVCCARYILMPDLHPKSLWF